MKRLAYFLVASSLLVAFCSCGAKVGGPGDSAGEPVLIEVSPADATLIVVNGAAVEQGYKVLATFDSGEVLDVTSESAFSIDDSILGVFSGDVLRALGGAGGQSRVRAVYKSEAAETGVTVTVNNTRVDDGAPANAQELFDGATVDATLAPSIVYPPNDVYMPPNLGDFESHWTSAAGSDLYEVSLSSAYSSTRLFTARDASAGAFAAFTPGEWKVVGDSARGEDITLTVRGLSTAAPQNVGVSPAIVVHLTNTDIEGGIYYWASQGALAEGVYRHDMSRPGQAAEAFYTTGETPSNRCVACHVLSREGDKMAVTYDGGNGAASIVDVATRTAMLPTDASFVWNFASFEPSGARIATVSQGVITLRDSATGAAINTVPTAGYASHVDFSATGDKIVYVQVAAPGADWDFTGGSLVVQSFDPATAAWGSPETLYTPPAGANAYYPSFSPDGEWVLFNQSAAGAYDAASAELYAVQSSGGLAPFQLSSPNLQAGLTNSWARWAPFIQELETDAGVEQFFWLTFSSKRAFGVRLPQGSPQLWMTPFFPDRVAAGGDPSGPAFRLPFQEISTNNHIAQWTTRIVPVD